MTEWIEWNGGECPIPDAKAGEYEIERRYGDQEIPLCNAKAADWQHENAFYECDIIAYRLIEKEQSDLDWLEGLVQVEFDHQRSKPPNYASISAREAYRNVLDFIKQRRKAKS